MALLYFYKSFLFLFLASAIAANQGDTAKHGNNNHGLGGPQHPPPLRIKRDALAAKHGNNNHGLGGPQYPPPPRIKRDANDDFTAPEHMLPRQQSVAAANGLSAIDTFSYGGETWTTFEDLTRFDGPLVLISASGKRREFPRNVEASSYSATTVTNTVEQLFGLDPQTVFEAQNDIIGERLLKDGGGEPIEEHVRDIMSPSFVANGDTFLGTVQANDTLAVDENSSTVNYQPVNDVPGALDGTHGKNWDGLLGWRPCSRKIFRGDVDAGDWIELFMFADVDAQDPKIVHIWYSTKWVKGGVVQQKAVALDYQEFLPMRRRPTVTAFYTALMRWADYWESKLADFAPLTLPDQTWADLAKHSFAMELVQRPSGVSSQYGTFDRTYSGSEYDGFQDIFTTSLAANLAWGRFAQAKAVFENYMDWYVYDNGDIKMRGPEVGQFGLSLSLIARYVHYTGDTALVEKYKNKILAWAKLLTDLHDEGLKLPKTDSAYGLLSGWSESDASMNFNSYVWVRPYWNNGAMAARGFKDLAMIPTFANYAKDWTKRAAQIINQTTVTMDKFIQKNLNPPYVPIVLDETTRAREAMAADSADTPQKWGHRVYAELLQASILSTNQTNTVINSMQAYGLTSYGVLANLDVFKPDTRDIIGFISYGYALSLLLQDRIDEFVLFLFNHRYRVYNRGQWVASEVAGTGNSSSSSAYCQPAQFGTPIVLRAALLFEHPDEEVLFVMKGVPRRWLSKGPVGIQKAPTRWGLVDYQTNMDVSAGTVTTVIGFHKAPPAEVRIKFRVPQGRHLKVATINGQAATILGEEVVWKLSSGASTQNATIVGKF